MGASASSNLQEESTNAISNTFQTCATGGVTDITNISGIKYRAPKGCVNPKFTIDQAATLDAKCVLGAIQKNTADLLSKVDSKTVAGLGISVSSDVQKNASNIEAYLKQKCDEKAVGNITNLTNSSISGICDFNIIQNGTAKEICDINATQDLISKISQKSTPDTEGGSIIGDLFGSGSNFKVFLFIVLLLAILSGIGFYFYKKQEKTGKVGPLSEDIPLDDMLFTGGYSDFFSDNATNNSWLDKFRKSSLFYIVTILVIVIAIFLSMGWANSKIKNKNKQITEDDVNKYKSMISDAKKIMETNSRHFESEYNNCPMQHQQSPTQYQQSPTQYQQSPTHVSPFISPQMSPQMRRNRNIYTMDSNGGQNSLNDLFKLPLEHTGTYYNESF